MKIQFKKHGAKPSTLTCTRSDGSVTWSTIHFGLEAHDLGHYAVEHILGFRNAFYGMIANGTDIQDFELPREERPLHVLPRNLDPEALISEHLVNLLMIKSQQPEELDLIPNLESILAENQIPYPKILSTTKMNTIWELFQKMLRQWEVLPKGGFLEYEFKLDPNP